MNTKNAFLTAVFALLTSQQLIVAAYAEDCSADIQAVETAWYDDLKAADGKALDRLLAGEFTYLHPTGNTYDKATVIDMFASKKVTVANVGPVTRSCHNFGPTVIAYGASSIDGMLAGQPYAGTMRYVDVWHQDNGAWKLVHRNSEILAAN